MKGIFGTYQSKDFPLLRSPGKFKCQPCLYLDIICAYYPRLMVLLHYFLASDGKGSAQGPASPCLKTRTLPYWLPIYVQLPALVKQRLAGCREYPVEHSRRACWPSQDRNLMHSDDACRFWRPQVICFGLGAVCLTT